MTPALIPQPRRILVLPCGCISDPSRPGSPTTHRCAEGERLTTARREAWAQWQRAIAACQALRVALDDAQNAYWAHYEDGVAGLRRKG